MAVKNTVEHVLQNQVPVGAENDNHDADDGTQIPRLFSSHWPGPDLNPVPLLASIIMMYIAF